jgi:O-antigen/teichoic acid export membrane protein
MGSLSPGPFRIEVLVSQRAAASLRRATSTQAFLGVAMSTASALSYVFVLILSRALGPGDFGGFSSLNSIGIVLAIPAGAFQIVVGSRVARKGPTALDLRLPVVVGAAGSLLTIALSPVLAHVTRVDSLLAPLIVGIGVLPLTVGGALMGGLLGMRRFRALGLVYLVAGLSRVAAAALAAALGAGVAGSFALVVAATTLTTALSWWLCRGYAHLPWSRPAGPRMRTLRTLFRSNSSMGVLMALTSADVVLARYVLDSVESGEYALVATLGRAPVWVTQFLALALVPALARSGSRQAVLRGCALVLGVCLVGAGVAAAAPELWVGILGGSAYQDAAGLLLPYLVLGTLLSLAQVLVIAEMAQGRHLIAKVAWAAVALEAVLVLTLWHDTPVQVLTAALVATGLVVAVGAGELLLTPQDLVQDDVRVEVPVRLPEEAP